ncbi:hypothetical protein BGZ58_002532 [Dissophora ornata]|nr:hypothetical protein BGZ58_002532 [Dissophora ornata]
MTVVKHPPARAKLTKADSQPLDTLTDKSEESAIEELRERLAAVSLELEAKKQELEDSNDDLASALEELEDTQTQLEETQLVLKNTEAARANSEQLRLAGSRERVLMRRPQHQEVFVVLKFRSPRALPDGGYRLFTLQQKAVDRTLRQFIANNPELDAVVMDELQFEGSPRGHYVFQRIKEDKDAPIDSSRRNFVLKEGRTEDEMITYITSVFNTHTQDL